MDIAVLKHHPLVHAMRTKEGYSLDPHVLPCIRTHYY